MLTNIKKQYLEQFISSDCDIFSIYSLLLNPTHLLFATGFRVFFLFSRLV